MNLRAPETTTIAAVASGKGATMRWLGLLFLPVLVLLAAACGDDGDESDATPTPTIQADETATPTVQADETATPQPNDFAETPGDEGFRAFIPVLQEGLDLGDLVFLSDRALTEPVVCTAEDLEPVGPGGPRCEFEGQSFDGFAVGRWRSEGAIIPISDAVSQLEALFSDVLPTATDEFGDGALRAYALNVGDGRFDAILAAIIETPEDFAGSGPLRVALGTSWSFEDGQWMLTRTLEAPVMAEDLLTPVEEVTSGLYANWERYEAP